MDVSELARDLAVFLAPFLPYLTKLGEQASEEAGKSLGAEAWQRAKALWARLSGGVEGKPALKEAAGDVTEDPADEDARAAFRLQIRKLLASDEELAGAIGGLLEEARLSGVQVSASGPRAVALGGTAIESNIVTGDRASVRVRSADRRKGTDQEL
jgi:hypothetical protein